MPKKAAPPDRDPEMKKPETQVTSADAVDKALQDRSPIRASRIVWRKPIELAGPASSQGSVREFLSDTNRRQYILEWYPWLRHFRVLWVEKAAEKNPELAETWVHESSASSWRRSFVKE